MNNKRAMTMKYLLTFVLAGFLLTLILYGVYGNRFGPLVDNIAGRADEVLILLHIKDPGSVSCGDAFEETIAGVGKGMFYPCENNCTFVLDEPGLRGGKKVFYINKNGFFSYGGISEFDSLLTEDLSYERLFYEESMNFMLDRFGHLGEDELSLGSFEDFVLCDYFCPKVKNIFFFGSHRSKRSGQLTYDGQNFKVEKFPSTLYVGSNKTIALRLFYGMVDNAIDWDITYRDDSSPRARDLSELGSLNKVFNDNQLDSDREVNALSELFKTWDDEKRRVSDDSVSILKEKFEGQTLTLSNGDEYLVSVDFDNANDLFPYLVFTSSSKKFALGYIYRIDASVWYRVDFIPLGLYEYENNGWKFIEGNKFYKLDSQEYDDILKINKIYENFKLRRCGP